MQIAIKEIVSYKGHSVKKNGVLDLTLSAMYGELTNSIKVLQLLNNDVKITVKLSGSNPMNLGVFSVKNVTFDGDGESILKFTSMVDYVEIDNINAIISQENFQIKLQSEIEMEEETED